MLDKKFLQTYTLPTPIGVGHHRTKSTNTGGNQWLSLTKIILKVPLVDRNRSVMTNTIRCGEGINLLISTLDCLVSELKGQRAPGLLFFFLFMCFEAPTTSLARTSPRSLCPSKFLRIVRYLPWNINVRKRPSNCPYATLIQCGCPCHDILKERDVLCISFITPHHTSLESGSRNSQRCTK